MNTKYRGAVVPPFSSASNYTPLLDHKANILRFEIVDGSGAYNNWDLTQWNEYVRSCLDSMDGTLLPLITDQKVLIDIHCPPGGMTGSLMNLFSTKPWGRVALLNMWEEIATRYKYNDKVGVYGILNEPGGTVKQVNSLMLDAVNRIRNVDKHKRIAVTNPYSNPETYAKMALIPGKRIWYESHMYWPLKFTHQGINGSPTGILYPNDKMTKKKLLNFMKAQRNFQVNNDVRCFVGEFSVSTFADTQSRINYLTDLTNIFESYGWNWSYHAWRESPVWSCETPPEVGQILYNAWAKNK